MIKQTLNNQPTSAVAILAGGQSQRMGQPKALLEYDGKSLLNHHIAAACELGLPALVCSDINDYSQHIAPDYVKHCVRNCVHIRDSISQQGALPAIAGAMQHLQTDGDLTKNRWLAVVSVDSVITVDQVLALFTQCHAISDIEQTDVLYLYDDVAKKDYPLLGLYRLRVLGTLNDYLAEGNRRVMRFLDLLNCTKVTMPTEWQNMTNMNTPDDYQQVLDMQLK